MGAVSMNRRPRTLRPRGRRARRAHRLVRLVEEKRLPSLLLLLGQLALAPLFVVRTAALDGGTRADLVDPALEARERRPHLLVDQPAGERRPRPRDDVGDGVVVAGEMPVRGELGVHDAAESIDLADEPSRAICE